MPVVPVFLSVVLVVRNQAAQLETLLTEAEAHVASCVSDYELIVVDNASDDSSVAELKRLAGEHGLPNLQVYALAKQVDTDTATWVGLENALGDFVAALDPMTDDIAFLPTMLESAVCGADVVFADNAQKVPQSLAYRMAASAFSALYVRFKGIHLAKEAPQYRMLSKRVVNFILQHSQPAVTYRHLPATGGFARVNLNYSAPPKSAGKKKLGESVERGLRLLVSTTHAPMRLVTTPSQSARPPRPWRSLPRTPKRFHCR